jgi:hypothetical protein
MSTFALLIPPAFLPEHLHWLTERSSTMPNSEELSIRSFGTQLEPR